MDDVIKVGDRVRVETMTGGGFLGTVMAISDNPKKYFVKNASGTVSCHNEIDTGPAPLREGEVWPQPISVEIFELPREFKPTPPVIPETPTWTKGQEIRSDEELWLVTEVFPDKDELEIEPLELSPHMETYIQKGNKYRLEKHSSFGFGKGEGLWEIPSESMTRSSSQVLLYLWEDGPSIEIDF